MSAATRIRLNLRQYRRAMETQAAWWTGGYRTLSHPFYPEAKPTLLSVLADVAARTEGGAR
jgi:hypothetical protein